MNKQIIESANVNQAAAKATAAAAAQFAAPFYAGSISQIAARAIALFWSVFGPAARYNFGNPEYAYAVSLKP
ncbi:MAG: hypothetical protein JST04_14755 [Bdellovibrionales bacterium]|nr:hypothetical protein [Bdellovibrionales bacterium]